MGSETVSLEELKALLQNLDELYPGSGPWLEKVQAQLRDGTADAFGYREAGELRAIGLGTAKGSKGYKIRTLYVDPRSRGRGVGSQILGELLGRARELGSSAVYITVSEDVLQDFQHLLSSRGLHPELVLKGRYREARAEIVFRAELL